MLIKPNLMPHCDCKKTLNLFWVCSIIKYKKKPTYKKVTVTFKSHRNSIGKFSSSQNSWLKCQDFIFKTYPDEHEKSISKDKQQNLTIPKRKNHSKNELRCWHSWFNDRCFHLCCQLIKVKMLSVSHIIN